MRQVHWNWWTASPPVSCSSTIAARSRSTAGPATSSCLLVVVGASGTCPTICRRRIVLRHAAVGSRRSDRALADAPDLQPSHGADNATIGGIRCWSIPTESETSVMPCRSGRRRLLPADGEKLDLREYDQQIPLLQNNFLDSTRGRPSKRCPTHSIWLWPAAIIPSIRSSTSGRVTTVYWCQPQHLRRSLQCGRRRVFGLHDPEVGRRLRGEPAVLP